MYQSTAKVALTKALLRELPVAAVADALAPGTRVVEVEPGSSGADAESIILALM
jgi:hypothetical protein